MGWTSRRMVLVKFYSIPIEPIGEGNASLAGQRNLSRRMTKWRAPSEDSDQPGHPPSLIRVFAVRSMGSEEFVFQFKFYFNKNCTQYNFPILMKIVSRGIQVNVSSAKTNIRSDSAIINKVSFTTDASNIA